MSEQNDTIYRRDAIDAICDEWCGRKNKDCLYPCDRSKDDLAYCDGCDDVERIKKLPPAQPSIPIEWIEEYSSKIDSEHETISACAIDDMLGAWREEQDNG